MGKRIGLLALATTLGCTVPLQESCALYCELAVSCVDDCPADEPRCAALHFGRPGLDECTTTCFDAYNDFALPCQSALDAYNRCLGELTCEEFRGEGLRACTQESSDVLEACPHVEGTNALSTSSAIR